MRLPFSPLSLEDEEEVVLIVGVVAAAAAHNMLPPRRLQVWFRGEVLRLLAYTEILLLLPDLTRAAQRLFSLSSSLLRILHLCFLSILSSRFLWGLGQLSPTWKRNFGRNAWSSEAAADPRQAVPQGGSRRLHPQGEAVLQCRPAPLRLLQVRPRLGDDQGRQKDSRPLLRPGCDRRLQRRGRGRSLGRRRRDDED